MASPIILNLVNSIPMQTWTFASQDVVRIGRATDNNIILFSAVVSRHHAEVRWSTDDGWQIVNLSSNGTYLDGVAIKTIKVQNGMVIRLATSGPKIQISVGSDPLAETLPDESLSA